MENVRTCSNCGCPVNDSAKFCRNCGYTVPPLEQPKVLCGVCGTELSPNARFCGVCGTVVTREAPPAPPQPQFYPPAADDRFMSTLVEEPQFMPPVAADDRFTSTLVEEPQFMPPVAADDRFMSTLVEEPQFMPPVAEPQFAPPVEEVQPAPAKQQQGETQVLSPELMAQVLQQVPSTPVAETPQYVPPVAQETRFTPPTPVVQDMQSTAFRPVNGQTNVLPNDYAPVPPAPVPPAPAPRQPKPQKSKGSGKAVVVILAVVLVLAALAAAFFLVHLWSDPVCGEAPTCKLCGKVKDEITEHVWTPVTCTTAETCSLCGLTRASALGHDWLGATPEKPAVCTRCGVEGDVLRPELWMVSMVSGGSADLGSGKVEELGTEVRVSFPNAKGFSGAEIKVTDYEGSVWRDAFVVTWEGEVATIRAGADLKHGVYDVNFQLSDGGAMITVFYGYANEILAGTGELFWFDSSWRSYVSGDYLAIDGNAVVMVDDRSKATVFGSDSEMIGVTKVDGKMTPTVKPRVYFESRAFLTGDGRELAAFVYQRHYLACDAEGNIYLTETLSEDCYWIKAN